LIGEMTTFSERISVTGTLDDGTVLVPAYRHQELWHCFSSAQSLVTQLLDEITAGPEYMMPLLFDGTYYATDLPPAIFEGRNRFFLALGNGFGSPGRDGFRGADRQIQLPGISADSNCPFPAGNQTHLPAGTTSGTAAAGQYPLFSDRPSWRALGPGSEWPQPGIYWDAAPEDLKAELMAVGRS
jgi:type VI secretion system protein ImpJ